MKGTPEEEADWLFRGEIFVIPVTVIFISDDDDDVEEADDEGKKCPSVKKKGEGHQPDLQDWCRKSRADTDDPGDHGTDIARATCEDASDAESHGALPPQLRPRHGRLRYPSNQSRSVENGGRSSPAPRRRELACTECSYSTNNSYSLACHARTHTGELPYKCTSCDLSFSTRRSLNRHAAVQNCGTPPGGAGRKAPKAEPRPLKCTDCEYSTLHSYNLKVHQRVHSDERPYRCCQCDSAFRTQSHLYRHERCHQKHAE